MNFKKKTFLLLFSLFVFTANAQQEKDIIPNNRYKPKDPEVGYFNFEVAKHFSYGNTALTHAYKLDREVSFGFTWFMFPSVTLGAFYNLSTAEVTNKSLVGNIESTGMYRGGIELGYYYAFNREWNLNVKAAIGGVTYRNVLPEAESKFRESGASYSLKVEGSYRFNQTMAIYATVGTHLDRLHIKSIPERKKFFNNLNLMYVGFGIRVHLHNPGG